MVSNEENDLNPNELNIHKFKYKIISKIAGK